MRHRFPGHFRPTTAEFDAMWKTAIIVPDANILLHLLRYGKDTRQQVLDTLRAFRPRVWVPYRVAFEFLTRWRTVDADNRGAYEKLKKSIRSEGGSLAGLFNDVSRHQIIDAKAERAKIEAFIEELCASLDDAEKTHPTVDDAEAILDEVAAIIGTEVGEAPTAEQREKWLKEGQERFNAKTPPGYMDMKGKSEEDKYGDFFIWEEMIATSKARNLPVIFISDDRKEDWILRGGGRDIGPRPELVQEFFTRTGQKFYAYPFRAFLERAKNYARVEVSPQAIAEIEEEERQARREAEAKEEAIRIADLVDLSATISSPATLAPNFATDYLNASATEEAWRNAVAADSIRDDLIKQFAAPRDAWKLAIGSNTFEDLSRQARVSADAWKIAPESNAFEAIRKQMMSAQDAIRSATGGSAFEEMLGQLAASQEAWKKFAGGANALAAFREQAAASREAWKHATEINAFSDLKREFSAAQEAIRMMTGGSAPEPSSAGHVASAAVDQGEEPASEIAPAQPEAVASSPPTPTETEAPKNET